MYLIEYSRSRHRKIESFHVMNKINISVLGVAGRLKGFFPIPLTISDIILYSIGSDGETFRCTCGT